MTIKSILVHVEAGPGGDRGLDLAHKVANDYGASLRGLGAEAFGPIFACGEAVADGAAIQIMRDRIANDLPMAEARFRAVVGDRPGTSWIAEQDYPDKMLSLHVRGADLIVASRPARGMDAAYAPKPVDLVLRAGAPVLLAADGEAVFQGQHVVVAWKDTRESRRAVSDALPFLKRAERVVLVAVTGEAELRDAGAGLAEVAERLALHGVKAEVEIVPKGDATVAEVLEVVAVRRRADLIVAGAFGRPHLQEWILGGVTEDLLAWSSKFLLLSH